MAALFAAFIHDVGHPGKNNNYLIATGDWEGGREERRGGGRSRFVCLWLCSLSTTLLHT